MNLSSQGVEIVGEIESENSADTKEDLPSLLLPMAVISAGFFAWELLT